MNFILFQPDELRAESIGCYGHPLAPTPNIDADVQQGLESRLLHWMVQTSDVTPFETDPRGLPVGV